MDNPKLPSPPLASNPAIRASMKGNRSYDTKPETAIRSGLHKRGHRFRKSYLLKLNGATVRPDIVFPRKKIAVFIDGCFWHSCPIHGHLPKSNQQYWAPKLERNRQRDRRNDAALLAAGWKVLRFWEHVPAAEAIDGIVALLLGPLPMPDKLP